MEYPKINNRKGMMARVQRKADSDSKKNIFPIINGDKKSLGIFSNGSEILVDNNPQIKTRFKIGNRSNRW